jgi:dTDP-4-amino-4,6-dideoxygalactose transaminase
LKDGHITFAYNALNYRMSDILAAVGVAQLAKLDRMIEKRRKMAQVYNDLLASRELPLQLLDDHDPRGYSTFQSYVMRLEGKLAAARDTVIRSMIKKYMIETQVATYSMHLQPAFKMARRLGRIANGPLLYRTSLTLPLYDSLTDAEQHYVIDSLIEVIRARE